MKISVITLHHVFNYGSVLQTFATQILMEKLGGEVEVVDYIRPNCRKEKILDIELPSGKPKYLILRIPGIKQLFRYWGRLNYEKNEKIFGDFVSHHIKLSRKYTDYKELKENPPLADIYCTGSDQMWNCIWNGGYRPEYYLEYAPTKAVKISFSTSFGRDSIGEEEKELVRNSLKEYKAISVREDSGLRILSSLGIEGGVHLLDPTLLLSSDIWQSTLEMSRLIAEDYILVYQLDSNRKINELARRLAVDNSVQVIKLSNRLMARFEYGKEYKINHVEEFLSLIKYAKYVITDSFHGTAFSINFNKQFYVCYPGRFSERLQSILRLTRLENRVIGENGDISTVDIDYALVNKVLESERKKAMLYLKQVIFANEEC